jgi:hypothetical protein
MLISKRKLERQIYSVLNEYDIRRDNRIAVKGTFDEFSIRYNSKKIEDEDDYYVTILHEILHISNPHWPENWVIHAERKFYPEFSQLLRKLLPEFKP